MLHIFKKLKPYTKPDTVHKAPISFYIKVYLWSLVDYEHLQKYFYDWNITLNYYFICKSNIRGNFIYLEMHLVGSNTHISTPLFCPLSKSVNDSKSYVPTVPMMMSFKVLKYFSGGKISSCLFPACGYKISN